MKAKVPMDMFGLKRVKPVREPVLGASASGVPCSTLPASVVSVGSLFALRHPHTNPFSHSSD